jgi:hypothetical protein
MTGREFWALGDVSDEALEASLGRLLGAGARLEARVIAHLAEVEARRLHLLLGCSSLFDYCRKRLGLSDYEAFVRIAAARVARKYPIVFELLDRRELHLTAICEVRDFLTRENHQELLHEVSGKTKLQIRECLRARFPLADLPSSVRRLPAVEPLAPDRYRLELTLNAEQKAKLELARDLLSHANPTADLAIVVERALDALIARTEQRRFGRTRTAPNRRKSATPSDSGGSDSRGSDLRGGDSRGSDSRGGDSHGGEVRLLETSTGSRNEPSSGRRAAKDREHISHQTRREVVARDGVRCAFVSYDGQRCDARAFLQFHHRQAWALGGHDGVENLELLCHAHNRLYAERDFGQAHVERASREARDAAQPKNKDPRFTLASQGR